MINVKNIKQIKTILIAIAVIFGLVGFLSAPAEAEPIPEGCPGSSQPTQPPPSECASIPLGCPGSSQQGPIASPPENCPYGSGSSSPSTECAGGDLSTGNCGITRYIAIFTNALSAIVGIVIVIMLVVGGIQYSAARDNPQAVQAARGRIINAIIALVMYLFMVGFLQWIVPGGVFNG